MAAGDAKAGGFALFDVGAYISPLTVGAFARQSLVCYAGADEEQTRTYSMESAAASGCSPLGQRGASDVFTDVMFVPRVPHNPWLRATQRRAVVLARASVLS